jgi:hypothetical protein
MWISRAVCHLRDIRGKQWTFQPRQKGRGGMTEDEGLACQRSLLMGNGSWLSISRLDFSRLGHTPDVVVSGTARCCVWSTSIVCESLQVLQRARHDRRHWPICPIFASPSGSWYFVSQTWTNAATLQAAGVVVLAMLEIGLMFAII